MFFKCRLYIGAISGDLVAEVPFKLANQDVVGDDKLIENEVQNSSNNDLRQRNGSKQIFREMSSDLIFEDFARRRQQSIDFD